MEEKSPIGSLLSQLREFNMKNKEVVDNLLREARELFGLENELDIISLDALLIQAIMYHVFGSKGEPAQIDKAHAVKRDTYLLALGLLDGYYHIKKDGSYYTASERHKQYLTDSDYMKLSMFKPSDNLDIDYAQSAPRRRLSTADKRCREKLESLLSDNKKCQKCFEKGKEKYIKKNENGERYIDLPKPCYTLNKFTNKDTDTESDAADTLAKEDDTEHEVNGQVNPIHNDLVDDETDDSDEREKFKEDTILSKGNNKILPTLLSIAVGGLVIVCVIQALTFYRHFASVSSDSSKVYGALDVESIKIKNKNLYLEPGEETWLDITIEPTDVQKEDLDYTSSDRSVVKTEKHHIIAQKGWKEDAKHDIIITVQGGDLAEDKAYITVTAPRSINNEKEGVSYGTNDDVFFDTD